ncbi:hypothetical protein GCM10020000_23450 [Streptomyces olivoverticillatus]
MLTWWPSDRCGDQYSDGFWPTVDPYRLPGTTVSALPLADNQGGGWGAPKPAVRWVGGVTDGEFAAVGQHLKGLGSTLEARKSWFCADDAVICLGAGISARDGTTVETIIDNRNLNGEDSARLTVDGEPQPSDGDDWAETFERAHWAHLEGHGGYVFPGGAPLEALRTRRTGSWRDINALGSPAPPSPAATSPSATRTARTPRTVRTSTCSCPAPTRTPSPPGPRRPPGSPSSPTPPRARPCAC